MRLFRTIASAQGGRVFANMGMAFGLSDELAAQAARYFVPPIVKSVNRRTETSKGLLAFLDFLGSHSKERYWTDTEMFVDPIAEEDGRAVLAELFPNPAHIRKIISNRAKVLPVAPEVLDAMFPYVALLALTAVERRAREPLSTILRRLASHQGEASSNVNPYVTLASEIRRRRVTSKALRANSGTGLYGVLGALFSRHDARPAA